MRNALLDRAQGGLGLTGPLAYAVASATEAPSMASCAQSDPVLRLAVPLNPEAVPTLALVVKDVKL